MLGSGCAQQAAHLTQSRPAKPAASANAGLQFDLARVSEKQGRLLKAQELYLSLLEQNPSDARVLHRLGVVAARLDQHEQATHYFMRALRQEPHNGDVLTDLGYALYLQNDLTGAETALRQAMKENTQNTRAANNLALVMGQMGRMDESYALFRRTVGDAEATSNMAYIHAQRGEIEKSAQRYSQALTLDSELEKATVALVQIAEQQYLAKATAPRQAPTDADTLTASQPIEPAAPAEPPVEFNGELLPISADASEMTVRNADAASPAWYGTDSAAEQEPARIRVQY